MGVKAALADHGHEAFLCDAGTGDTFETQIRNALTTCDCFVPFITLDPPYGAQGDSPFSSYFELDWAHQNKTLMAPILMYEPKEWPPKRLASKLEEIGDKDAAGLIRFAFRPAQV